MRKLVQLDSSEEMLHRDTDIPVEGSHRCDTYRLHADEDGQKLPFPDGTFDLVMSSQALHWVNDLPGLLQEVKVWTIVKRFESLSVDIDCDVKDNGSNFFSIFEESPETRWLLHVFNDWRGNSAGASCLLGLS